MNRLVIVVYVRSSRRRRHPLRYHEIYYCYRRRRIHVSVLISMLVAAAEVRVLHQIQLVDRINLLARDDGRGSAHVMMMVVVVVVLGVGVQVLVVHAVVHRQVQRHGVRADLVRGRGAAVQGYIRTAEAVHRMVARVRTCGDDDTC